MNCKIADQTPLKTRPGGRHPLTAAVRKLDLNNQPAGALTATAAENRDVLTIERMAMTAQDNRLALKVVFYIIRRGTCDNSTSGSKPPQAQARARFMFKVLSSRKAFGLDSCFQVGLVRQVVMPFPSVNILPMNCRSCLAA